MSKVGFNLFKYSAFLKHHLVIQLSKSPFWHFLLWNRNWLPIVILRSHSSGDYKQVCQKRNGISEAQIPSYILEVKKVYLLQYSIFSTTYLPKSIAVSNCKARGHMHFWVLLGELQSHPEKCPSPNWAPPIRMVHFYSCQAMGNLSGPLLPLSGGSQ